ncbi:hypothetical protein PV325_003331 [Microctonus aethiopoides]|nr:hypothetical protein PV325_003331 [Microctonus aethiopoides]
MARLHPTPFHHHLSGPLASPPVPTAITNATSTSSCSIGNGNSTRLPIAARRFNRPDHSLISQTLSDHAYQSNTSVTFGTGGLKEGLTIYPNTNVRLVAIVHCSFIQYPSLKLAKERTMGWMISSVYSQTEQCKAFRRLELHLTPPSPPLPHHHRPQRWVRAWYTSTVIQRKLYTPRRSR